MVGYCTLNVFVESGTERQPTIDKQGLQVSHVCENVFERRFFIIIIIKKVILILMSKKNTNHGKHTHLMNYVDSKYFREEHTDQV